MNIEYFPDASADGPFILIYGIDSGSVSHLKEAIGALATKRSKRFAVHDLPGFSSIDNCRLFFSIAKKDFGIVMLKAPLTFECRLQPTSWDNVEGLLEPFAERDFTRGFQWLHHGAVDLLVSADRSW